MVFEATLLWAATLLPFDTSCQLQRAFKFMVSSLAVVWSNLFCFRSEVLSGASSRDSISPFNVNCIDIVWELETPKSREYLGFHFFPATVDFFGICVCEWMPVSILMSFDKCIRWWAACVSEPAEGFLSWSCIFHVKVRTGQLPIFVLKKSENSICRVVCLQVQSAFSYPESSRFLDSRSTPGRLWEHQVSTAISYPESSGFLVSEATPGRLWGHQISTAFSSPEPLSLICNDHVTKKRRTLGTRIISTAQILRFRLLCACLSS